MKKRSTFRTAAHIAAIVGFILLIHLHARLAYALFLPSVSYRLVEYEFWDSFWTYTSDPATTVPTHFLGLMLMCIVLAVLILLTMPITTRWMTNMRK